MNVGLPLLDEFLNAKGWEALAWLVGIPVFLGVFGWAVVSLTKRVAQRLRDRGSSLPDRVEAAWENVALASILVGMVLFAALCIALAGFLGYAWLTSEDSAAPMGDLDCTQLEGAVRVGSSDPHRLDRDGNGLGCEWGPDGKPSTGDEGLVSEPPPPERAYPSCQGPRCVP